MWTKRCGDGHHLLQRLNLVPKPQRLVNLHPKTTTLRQYAHRNHNALSICTLQPQRFGTMHTEATTFLIMHAETTTLRQYAQIEEKLELQRYLGEVPLQKAEDS